MFLVMQDTPIAWLRCEGTMYVFLNVKYEYGGLVLL